MSLGTHVRVTRAARVHTRGVCWRAYLLTRDRALTRRISRIPCELHACVRTCVCAYIELRVPTRGGTAACWPISAVDQAVADNSPNADAHSVIRIRTHSFKETTCVLSFLNVKRYLEMIFFIHIYISYNLATVVSCL